MPIAEHDTAPFFSLDGRRACVIVSVAIHVAYVAVSFDTGRHRATPMRPGRIAKLCSVANFVPVLSIGPTVFYSISLAAGVYGQMHVALLCSLCAGLCLGQMMRRTELAAERAVQASARLGNVVDVGNGDPQQAMRAAARWGSDVLGRVARGENAAQAVAEAALDQSDAGSATSEQELNGFDSFAPDRRAHSSWIHNAIRSVTPTADGLTPRDFARMGTVPEDVPYHGQPLVRAQPPERRAAHSPPRA